MKSKYKERAYFLLLTNLKWLEGNYDMSEDETNSVIKAMCQLAEEVESKTVSVLLDSSRISYYSKEQVEELLQKQRELCADEAYAIGEGTNITTKNGNLFWTFAGNIGKVVLDTYSILNAKLKIN